MNKEARVLTVAVVVVVLGGLDGGGGGACEEEGGVVLVGRLAGTGEGEEAAGPCLPPVGDFRMTSIDSPNYA